MVKINVKTFCSFFALIIKFPSAAWISSIAVPVLDSQVFLNALHMISTILF